MSNVFTYGGNKIFTNFPGSLHLPPVRLDIIPMSFSHEQPWIGPFHQFFIFPMGLIRPKVPPLQFNLGNSSSPQLYFSLVEDAQWLDEDFSFQFDLQHATFEVSFLENEAFDKSIVTTISHLNVLPSYDMSRVVNIFFQH